MEQSIDSSQMLEHLLCPAFLVSDGIITHANTAVLQRQLSLNKPVAQFISVGAEDYAIFKEGKLCLTLSISDIEYPAIVTAVYGYHLFCLDSEYTNAEFRAFSLTAQSLRKPLSNIASAVEQLTQQLPGQDPSQKLQVNQINRSLLQLLRSVSNMSDAPQYKEGNGFTMQSQDAVSVFTEILEKSATLAARDEKTLNYHIPKLSVTTLLDRVALERAAFNLISNAIKYSEKNSIINAEVFYRSYRLYFSVENEVSNGDCVDSNYFLRFLREPGIEDGRNGIGLGLSIVHSVASKHGGTVLLEHTAPNRVRITMSIRTQNDSDNIFKSPVRLPVDYSGGFDHAILELSDALSATALDENM